MFLCSYVKEKHIAANLEGHGDVVSEELAGAEALRHTDVGTIDIRGKLGDGVQANVTLKG